MSQTTTATNTYSVADIEAVMRRVTADLVMIASSTGAITEAKAREWAHDIELLAKNGHLRVADITLLSNGVEQRATRYTVDSETGSLSMSRPGGVLWPKVPNAYLRIVLSYNKSYDKDAKESYATNLRRAGLTQTQIRAIRRSKPTLIAATPAMHTACNDRITSDDPTQRV